MPFYEYQAIDAEKSCSFCIDGFEVMQSMSDKPLSRCPECGSDIHKMLSQIGGIIVSRMPNQYNDITKAKYWRDHNGVKHKVTAGDGHSNSPTVSRERTRTDAQVEAIKKAEQKINKKRRNAESYNRFLQQVKK